MNVKAIRIKRRERPDGTAPIWIRVTHKGKVTYTSMEEWVRDDQWDEFASQVVNHKRKSEINGLIVSKVKELMDTSYELKKKQNGKFTLNQVGKSIEVDSRSFFQFARDWSDRDYNTPDQIRTFKRYLAHLSKLKQFLAFKKSRKLTQQQLNDAHTDPRLEWFEINVTFLKEFESWMRKKLNNGSNTVGSTMKSIRAIYNAAIVEEVADVRLYPFGHRKYVLPSEKTNAEEMTVEELHKLRDLQLVENSGMYNTRSITLCQYLLGGLRFGDSLTMTWSMFKRKGDDEYYTFEREATKTGKAIHSIVPEKAKEILRHYRAMYPNAKKSDFVFANVLKIVAEDKLMDKVSSCTTLCNQHLKQMAEIAGIDRNLTTHMFRHAFAHEAHRKGKSIELIQRALGHSDLKTTQIYMRKLTGKEVADEMADVVTDL